MLYFGWIEKERANADAVSDLCFVLWLSGLKLAADIIDPYILSLSSPQIGAKRKVDCESQSSFQSLWFPIDLALALVEKLNVLPSSVCTD